VQSRQRFDVDIGQRKTSRDRPVKPASLHWNYSTKISCDISVHIRQHDCVSETKCPAGNKTFLSFTRITEYSIISRIAVAVARITVFYN